MNDIDSRFLSDTCRYQHNMARNRVSSIEPPCRKTIYHSREEAEDISKYIEENRGGPALFAYKCEVCGFWHLTRGSKPIKNR